MTQEQKYEMEITLSLKKVGSSEPMATTNQTYNNMDYADTVNVQQALANALVGLGLEAIKLKKQHA